MRRSTTVEQAQRHDPKVWVEAFADGAREIECGVLPGLDDGPAEAGVVAEIKVGGEHEFFDFAARYLPEEATELDVPADVWVESGLDYRALVYRLITVAVQRPLGLR